MHNGSCSKDIQETLSTSSFSSVDEEELWPKVIVIGAVGWGAPTNSQQPLQRPCEPGEIFLQVAEFPGSAVEQSLQMEEEEEEITVNQGAADPITKDHMNRSWFVSEVGAGAWKICGKRENSSQ